jgi:hypothetical protein
LAPQVREGSGTFIYRSSLGQRIKLLIQPHQVGLLPWRQAEK